MGQVLMRRLLALAASYGLACVTTLNGVIYSLIRDNYWKYQVLFYVSLFGLSFGAFPLRGAAARLRGLLLRGAIAGYTAGLITFFFSPLFNRWDVGRVFTVRDLDFVFFASPAVILCWLVGIFFGLGLFVQDHMLPARRNIVDKK